MNDHAMEPSTIRIGSRKATASVTDDKPKYSKPEGKVTLLMRNTEVGTKDLETLIRFSTCVALAFPKPSDAVRTHTRSLEGSVATIIQQSGEGENRMTILNIDDRRFRQMPSVQAVTVILKWMEIAKGTSRGGMVPHLAAPDTSEGQLHVLAVEVYAASLLLGVRPTAQTLLGQLMNEVSTSRPTLNRLKAIHDHLPTQDVLLSRFISSFYDKVEGLSDYVGEDKEINDYAYTSDIQLYRRFDSIWACRERKFGPSKPIYEETKHKMRDVAEESTGFAEGSGDLAQAVKSVENENEGEVEKQLSKAGGVGTAAGPKAGVATTKRKGRASKKGLNTKGEKVPGANYD